MLAHSRGVEGVSSLEPVHEAYSRPNQELVRVTITIDKATRKRIRIAAAYADMEVGDWVTGALREAAERTIRGEELRVESSGSANEQSAQAGAQ